MRHQISLTSDKTQHSTYMRLYYESFIYCIMLSFRSCMVDECTGNGYRDRQLSI